MKIKSGWRIPSEADFQALESFVAADGHSGNEATVLKSTHGWAGGDHGTDIYGFNGLPNGYVTNGGSATGAQAIASWATTNTNSTNRTRRIVNLLIGDPLVLYADNSTLLGAGVRCIKD